MSPTAAPGLVEYPNQNTDEEFHDSDFTDHLHRSAP
jgi:hypothetical protein